MSFPMVALSEIAHPVHRPVPVIPGISYRTIGVKWWGEGAYERETIDGAQTAARSLSQVREGDLIINKIWVRHGSTAVASKSVDGCTASGEFPTFELDCTKILPEWMHWQTKSQTFWTKCDHLSRGTSGKNRIKPELFLTIKIPLPPLEEQRRIVARIEKLATKVEEARRLRKEAEEACDNLCRSIIFHGPENKQAIMTPMQELVTLRETDVKVEQDETYHFAGVYCFGKGVFKGSSKSGMEFAYNRLTRLQTGNFVYPKLMAWEGALGVVPPDCDGLVVSPEFPVFKINQERVLPETLDVYFRTPSIWPTLSGASTGTNVRRRRLNPVDFLKLEFPLPSMEKQLQLRAIKARVDAVRQLQAETRAELDGLLPSILDKAFRGELV